MRACALTFVAALAVLFVACGGGAPAATTQLVDVGGHKLSVACRGDAGPPTVVVEVGRGNVGNDWAHVAEDVAKFARVCTYDRAGLGASDSRATTATGDDVARELHKALEAIGVEPPYVLVGHSIGALYTRLFAEQFPVEAEGIVFVDGSSEGQLEPGGSDDPATFGNEGLSHIDLTDAVAELQNARSLGDIPIVSIHGGANMDPTWLGYHYDQALLSTNSHFVIANHSAHFPYETQPDIVIEAIRLTVEAARSGAPLAVCKASFDGGEASCVPLVRPVR